MRQIICSLLMVLSALAPLPTFGADAEHGKALFQACVACHTEKPEAMGPSLKAVFGRKSATLEDFRYSNAMKRANIIWDEANLRSYLVDPQVLVKGNRMPFSGLREPKDLDDVVAYLKTFN